MVAMTRAHKRTLQARVSRQGLSVDSIVEGKRNVHVPDRLGSPPRIYRDRFGNRHLNPGSSAMMTVQMPLSGDSRRDITKLVRLTGMGGRGSGLVWHHVSKRDLRLRSGPVILMPRRDHAASHVGSSAETRAMMYDDPDKKAKLGLT